VRVTFIGTGTSQGVPVISCTCPVCTSTDKRDNRLRSSVWIEVDGVSIVIDSGPDFRYQMLRSKVNKLDAVIFTHSHKDHIAGLDDIRAYNYFNNRPMDVYASEDTQEALRREYAYIFENADYPGIPKIEVHTINGKDPFYINGVKITPVIVMHYKMEVLGFRIKDFTYITDANYIAPQELEKIKGSKAIVLNALRHQQHVSHYTLAEAVNVARESGAEKAYFTHISHQLGKHEDINRTLPEGMVLAHDCLAIEL
jgi:phosphoribosyl 1,2-cyclic phosphate phosphodiesterase